MNVHKCFKPGQISIAQPINPAISKQIRSTQEQGKSNNIHESEEGEEKISQFNQDRDKQAYEHEEPPKSKAGDYTKQQKQRRRRIRTTFAAEIWASQRFEASRTLEKIIGG